jgi:hypothetical protein
VSFPPECRQKFVDQSVDRGARDMWPIGDHIALLPPNATNYTNVVTFFREPRSRTISHATMYTKSKFRNLVMSNSTVKVVDDYVNSLPNIHSWQSNFVMGIMPSHHVQSSVTYSGKLVDEMCRRVRNFAFVGIVELWKASNCIFHDKYGGQLKRADVGIFRMGQYDSKRESVFGSEYLRDFYPEPDVALFSCAVEVFARDIMDSKTPYCVHLLQKEIAQLDERSWQAYRPSLDQAIATYKQHNGRAKHRDNIVDIKFTPSEPVRKEAKLNGNRVRASRFKKIKNGSGVKLH